MQKEINLDEPTQNVFTDEKEEDLFDAVLLEDAKNVFTIDEPPKTGFSRKVSRAWTYFTKLSSTEQKCNLCQRITKSRGGNTTNMQYHLARYHDSPLQNKEKIEENETTLNNFQSRQPQSKVWIYFDRVSSSHAVCKTCFKVISFSRGSTSGLRLHLVKVHKISNSQLMPSKQNFAELPYQCDLCSRVFQREEHLEVHQRIHVNVPAELMSRI